MKSVNYKYTNQDIINIKLLNVSIKTSVYQQWHANILQHCDHIDTEHISILSKYVNAKRTTGDCSDAQLHTGVSQIK